jgi:hypothetical protein
MKLSRAPVFVLVNMGRYCQERAMKVLNDFAAAGTFLLNDEEPFRGARVSQLQRMKRLIVVPNELRLGTCQ